MAKESIFFRTKNGVVKSSGGRGTQRSPGSSSVSSSPSWMSSSSFTPLSKIQLKVALNSYRTYAAGRDDVPVYCVLTNAVVESLVQAVPLTERDLLRVKGIGPAKVEKYGAEILALLRRAKGVDGSGGGRGSGEVGGASTADGGGKTDPGQARHPKLEKQDGEQAPGPGSGGASARPRKSREDERKLSEEQRHVLAAALAGQSLFFTGSAGTGKSFLLRVLIDRLRERHGRQAVFVTAPTGIAACNVGGTTLNSFAGVGLGREDAETLAAIVCGNARKVKNWRQAQVLVIDEVSMLDGHLLDKLDAVARRAREKEDTPFGGIQVILCGDFFQLPPIGIGSGKDIFCFEARVWPQLIKPERQLVLRQVFRQRDESFVRCLRELRVGQASEATVETLMETQFNKLDCGGNQGDSTADSSASIGLGSTGKSGSEGGKGTIEPTRLYSHNSMVDKENNSRLHRLPGHSISYRAVDIGSQAAQRLQHCSSPPIVSLKLGAQVVLLKNMEAYTGLANGSRGVVIGFEVPPVEDGKKAKAGKDGDVASFFQPKEKAQRVGDGPVTVSADSEDDVFPRVKFQLADGSTTTRTVRCAETSITEGSRVVATRKQIPLKLAWALSIHKSQGMTIGLLEADVGKCFDYGQCYVALSRAVSLPKLRVLNFDAGKVRAHPKVIAFDAKLESYQSPSQMSTQSSSVKPQSVAPVTQSLKVSPPQSIFTPGCSSSRPPPSSSTSALVSPSITAEQRQRMEKNRQAALHKRQQRLRQQQQEQRALASARLVPATAHPHPDRKARHLCGQAQKRKQEQQSGVSSHNGVLDDEWEYEETRRMHAKQKFER